ncbi:MAG: glycosyltransferase family 87 protein [Candidatus Sulfotelmatobacter sp.]
MFKSRFQRPFSLNRTRIALGLGVVLLIMLLGQLQKYRHDYRTLRQAGSEGSEIPNDFPVYYVAAQTARELGDHRLYYPPENSLSTLLGVVPKDTPWDRMARADGFDKGTMAFVYPPFAALLLEPLSFWPWPLSLFFWRIALTAMVLLAVYLALLLTQTGHLLLHFVLISATVLWFFPFTETIYQGQIDPIIFLCWVSGVYLLATDRPVWSALLFAVGTLVKVSPVIVIPLFLLRRQWKWLISYTLWCGLLLGISIWRLGWENHLIWSAQVFPAMSQGVPYFANKSFSALIYEVYLGRVPTNFDFSIPHLLTRIVSLLNLAVYAATLFYFWKKNRRADALNYELIVFALLAIVISPVTWRHHFLLALLPMIYLWYRSRDDLRDSLVLAAATLAIGTVFTDFAIVAIRKPLLDLLLAAIVPITTFLMLIVALANYEPIRMGDGPQDPVADLTPAA